VLYNNNGTKGGEETVRGADGDKEQKTKSSF